MLTDYHIHTVLCKHADGEAEEYCKIAVKRGIEEICFTDHAPASDGYDPKNRMVIEEFELYRDKISSIALNDKPKILFGIEADYYEGCHIFLKEWLNLQAFDFVLGSVHYIENWGFDNPAEREIWDNVDVTRAWKAYFILVTKLAKTGMFDAIAHLDLPKKFGHRPSDKNLKEMAMPALDAIAKAGMAIELNTSGLRKPVGEIYPSPLLLSFARERDIPICFGSDAHLPEEVGYRFNEALKLAGEIGYTSATRFCKREKTSYSI